MTARELFDKVVPLLLAKDLDGFADLFAADGVHELPFAPPGVPRVIQGREQIRGYFAAITDTPLAHREFRSMTVHEPAGGEVIVAEYDAHGEVTTTGQPYVLRYVNVLEARDGDIACWRDYWNPVDGFDLLGRLPDLIAAR